MRGEHPSRCALSARQADLDECPPLQKKHKGDSEGGRSVMKICKYMYLCTYHIIK